MINDKCYACDKILSGKTFWAITRDGQKVHIGPVCFKKIKAAFPEGYQPTLGGPKLYLIAATEKKRG